MRPLLTLTFSLLILAIFGCSETTTPKPPPPVTVDPALAGDWQVVGIQAAGQEIPADKIKAMNMTYTFTDKLLTIRRPDKPDSSCTYSADAAASPKRIVLDQTPAVYGLYAVEGDTMQLCLMVDDAHQGKHPGTIASNVSPATDLLTFKRVGTTAAATPITPTPVPTTPPAVPPAPATDNNPALAGRTLWRFKDAPKVFPDQTEFSGTFRLREGKQWYSEKADGSFYHDYEETAVTPEYVEIMRPGGGFFVRLYGDRADYRFGNQPDFQKMFAGRWDK